MNAIGADAPILHSAAAGMARLRAHWREAGFVALACSGALAALTILGLAAPALALPALALQLLIPAAGYAALTGLMLNGAIAAPARLVGDGGRVWAAMFVIGFFLFIVVVVAAIPSLVIIGVAATPFAAELEAFQSRPPDPAVARDLVGRMASANPWPFILVGFGNSVVWMMITSRLFLVAPATVAAGAIRTFETWALTKNFMWRIAAARLALLAPAAIPPAALMLALAAGLGLYQFPTEMGANLFNLAAAALFGLDSVADAEALIEFARTQPVLFGLLQFVHGAARLFLYFGLEAGLSAHFHAGLAGQSAPGAQR